MDSKNIEIEPLVWYISDDQKSYDHHGKIPKNGEILPVVLINKNTKTRYEGEYMVETKLNGCIEVFEIKNNKKIRTVIKTGIQADLGSSSSSSSSLSLHEKINEWWNSIFANHMNIDIIDNLIQRLEEAETTYVTIENPDTENSSKDKASKSVKKVKILQKKIKVLKDKLYVYKGLIQSGKSQFMIDHTIKFLSIGKSCIIVFQYTGHLTQFHERIKEVQKMMINNAKKLGINPPLDLICTEIKGNLTVENLIDSLSDNGIPQLYLCIGTDKQFQTFNQKFMEVSAQHEQEIMNNYCLFIDEADHVDSSTGAKKGDSLHILKKYAYFVGEVSATVLDLVAREEVKPDNLLMLKPPPTYRGIPSFNIIRTLEEAKYSSRKGARILNLDPALNGLIENFAGNKILTYCALYKDYHPWIMLINNGRSVRPQISLIQELKHQYTDLTLMAYVGDGVYLYHKSLSSEPFLINGNKSVLQNGVHRFKKISPSSALLWLKRNGGYQKFHHILISSGDLAGRSISYACKDDSSDGLPFWHLTHHRLVLPANTPAPEVEQKCRLCTIFESPVPLTLYVSEKDENEVIKSYWMQEELIERAKLLPNDEYLKEIMSRIKMSRSKLPSGRPLTKDRKLVVCKKISRNQDDGGLPLDIYGFDGKYDRERPPIQQVLLENEEKKTQNNKDEEDAKYGMRLVDPSKIDNTTMLYIMHKAVGDAYEYLVQNHPDQWIPLIEIVDWISENFQKYDTRGNDVPSIKDKLKDYIRATLNPLYDKKYKGTKNEEEKGMIIKKQNFGGKVLVRIN